MPNLNPSPQINGVRHAWASISFNWLGRTVTGIAKIDYSDTVKMENQYGAGNMPSHRSVGNYEAKASIDLYQFEVVGMQLSTLGKRIQSIAPFDIIVCFRPEGQDLLVTDIIRNVQFTNNARSLNQGDTMSKVPLELICSHIKWHGQTED